MSGTVTIPLSRQDLAREANHEITAIVDLMKTKFTGVDVSVEDLLLMRGLAQRLWVLNDVIYDTVINNETINEADLAGTLGLSV